MPGAPLRDGRAPLARRASPRVGSGRSSSHGSRPSPERGGDPRCRPPSRRRDRLRWDASPPFAAVSPRVEGRLPRAAPSGLWIWRDGSSARESLLGDLA